MTKFLLRSHLCLIILLLSGFAKSSAHTAADSDFCDSSDALFSLEQEVTCDDEFFNSLPPEELRHFFDVHATEIREEEEDHEEITCKKKTDDGKYLATIRAVGALDYFVRGGDVILPHTAKLRHTATFKRYLEFRVFRI